MKKLLKIATSFLTCEFLPSLAVAVLFYGCLPTPAPVPTPGPTPEPPPAVIDASYPTPDAPTTTDSYPAADVQPTNSRFTGKSFNCFLPVVLAERASATDPVSKCLEAPPADCLAKLVGQFDVATVACVARDVGSSSLVSVRLGAAGPLDAVRARNAIDWILAEQLGYF